MGIESDEVDLALYGFHETDQSVGILDGVVQASQHDVFNKHGSVSISWK